MQTPQILIYKTDDGKIKIGTLVKDESIWMSQKTIGELFDGRFQKINSEIHLHFK